MPPPGNNGNTNNGDGGQGRSYKDRKGGKKKQRQRQRQRHNESSSHYHPTSCVPAKLFDVGKCDELKGHVYDCSLDDTVAATAATAQRQSDQFIRTTKEIAQYVGLTYKYGVDTQLAVENLDKQPLLSVLAMPSDPPMNATKMDELIWEMELEEYFERTSYLEENLKTLYSLVWGQCTVMMQQKVETTDHFQAMSAAQDGLALLKTIKDIVYNFDSQKYRPHALHEVMQRFYECSQGRHDTNRVYLEQFQNIVDVIERSGGSIGEHPEIEKALMVEKEIDDISLLSTVERSEFKREARDRYLAVAFLLGADMGRHGQLITNLENSYLLGKNNYPKTVTEAYSLLSKSSQV